MILGLFSEYWSYLIGREPTFTRFRVSYTCAQRYHCIERARRVLGFVPEVGLEEGVKKMVEAFKKENGLP